MTSNACRWPPDAVDMEAEESAIRRYMTILIVVTLAGFTAAF